MNIEILKQARDLLENVTPLRTDCGATCDHACCRADEDGQGGVFLFPDERSMTGDWGEIVSAELLPGFPADMLICHAPCDRSLRPLACRFFPLTPILKKDGSWAVRMDRRAFAMCPLAPHKAAGLDPVFVENAKKSIEIIASDPEGRAFLDAWRKLEKQYSEMIL